MSELLGETTQYLRLRAIFSMFLTFFNSKICGGIASSHRLVYDNIVVVEVSEKAISGKTNFLRYFVAE